MFRNHVCLTAIQYLYKKLVFPSSSHLFPLPQSLLSLYYILYFTFYIQYDVVKERLIASTVGGGRKSDPAWIMLLAGGIAGCATWMPPVYFLDVLKTRMQTAPQGTYVSNWDCVVKTWRWASGLVDAGGREWTFSPNI